jgi:hypothetical protein
MKYRKNGAHNLVNTVNENNGKINLFAFYLIIVTPSVMTSSWIHKSRSLLDKLSTDQHFEKELYSGQS